MRQAIQNILIYASAALFAGTLSAATTFFDSTVLSVDAENLTVNIKDAPGNTYEFKIGKGDLPLLTEGAPIRAEKVKFGKGYRLEHIWPNDPMKQKIIDTAQRRLRQDTVTRGHKVYRAVGEPLPLFALYNQHGELVLPRDWRGKNVVINFIFTRCRAPKMCPASTQRMIELQHQAQDSGLENYHLITITFDPKFDSPGVLNQYVINKGIQTDAHELLTGPKPMVDDLMKQFGIFTVNKDGTIDHTMATLIIDDKGKIAYRKDGSQWSVDDFAKRLKRMEDKE